MKIDYYTTSSYCRVCNFCCRKLDIYIMFWGPAAELAEFLKALYFRRMKTWMLHTLNIYQDASGYQVSLSHMSNVLDLIFMVECLLEKKVKIFIRLQKFKILVVYWYEVGVVVVIRRHLVFTL